jgi:hypothetical protein
MTPSVIRWPLRSGTAELTFGWETAFASIFDLPNVVRDGGTNLFFVLFAPVVNATFIIAISIELVVAYRGVAADTLQNIGHAIASMAVPVAVLGVVMFVFVVFLDAGLNGGEALPIGVIPWTAAYLTLGLRLRRRPRATGTFSI